MTSQHSSSSMSSAAITKATNFTTSQQQSTVENSVQIEVPKATTKGDGTQTFTPQSVIWGTNVVIDACQQRFKTFINTFTLAQGIGGGDNEDEPYYLECLNDIHLIGDPYLNLNCQHLKSYDAELLKQLVTYPREVIPIFDIAANELFSARYPEDNLSHPIQIRPFNPGELGERSLRMLEPTDLDKIIQVPGMVTRVSPLIPEMRKAYFQCEKCGHHEIVEMQSNARFEEPVMCVQCRATNLFKLVHNMSYFSDRQVVKLQEDPNCTQAGDTPHSLVLVVHDDLVDKVQPGDRVDVTGIFKASSIRLPTKSHSIRSIYRTFVDVLHFNVVHMYKSDGGGKTTSVESNTEVFTDMEIDRIKQISKLPNIFDKLSSSIAPAIYGALDIKKGLLLQLLGGTDKKSLSNAGSNDNVKSKIRSEINILLCGDPGTSKSQILKYIYDLVPRSQYTSGKGSSAVGLTAFVTKDPDTKNLVLQSGALVLADNGICCIDEFDKMSDHVRSVLHEVMEQQTMSIAKAGIICTLNARVAILAAANPVDSHWNPKKTIIDNLKLPSTLLSRFDLIFLVLDPQNEDHDRMLAGHLVGLFTKTDISRAESAAGQPIQHSADLIGNITQMDLQKYIAYAKANVHPKLTEECSSRLIDAYVEMRSTGSLTGQVSAYPRQLESLIRLSEAHAKCRLSDTVSAEDIDVAIQLHKEALRQSATDPTTGRIDVSILTMGTSAASRKQHQEIAKTIRTLADQFGAKRVSASDLYEKLSAGSDIIVKRTDFESALKILENEGFLKVGPAGQIRVVLHSI